MDRPELLSIVASRSSLEAEDPQGTARTIVPPAGVQVLEVTFPLQESDLEIEEGADAELRDEDLLGGRWTRLARRAALWTAAIALGAATGWLGAALIRSSHSAVCGARTRILRASRPRVEATVAETVVDGIPVLAPKRALREDGIRARHAAGGVVELSPSRPPAGGGR
jgi:hypothetical protein